MGLLKNFLFVQHHLPQIWRSLYGPQIPDNDYCHVNWPLSAYTCFSVSVYLPHYILITSCFVTFIQFQGRVPCSHFDQVSHIFSGRQNNLLCIRWQSYMSPRGCHCIPCLQIRFMQNFHPEVQHAVMYILLLTILTLFSLVVFLLWYLLLLGQLSLYWYNFWAYAIQYLLGML